MLLALLLVVRNETVLMKLQGDSISSPLVSEGGSTEERNMSEEIYKEKKLTVHLLKITKNMPACSN